MMKSTSKLIKSVIIYFVIFGFITGNVYAVDPSSRLNTVTPDTSYKNVQNMLLKDNKDIASPKEENLPKLDLDKFNTGKQEESQNGTSDANSSMLSTSNDPSTAIPIALDQWYSNVMTAQGEEHWYIVDVPSSGKITAIMLPVDNPNIDYDLTLYTASGTPLISQYGPQNYEQVSNVVSAGSYYLCVNSYAGFDAVNPYYISVTYSSSYDGAEPDDNVWQKKQYSGNFTVTQTMDNLYDEDWIAYSVSTTGNMTMFFDNIPDTCSYKVDIFNSSLGSISTVAQNKIYEARLNAGTYYFRVRSENGFGSGYRLEVSFSSTISLRWQQTFGGTSYDRGRCVQRTNDGGYIVAGDFYKDSVTYTYLLKTDVYGNKIWEKFVSSAYYPSSVRQTSDSGYIIGAQGGGKVWLVKTDSNGNMVWEKSFAGNENNCVQQTSDGGYITVGDIKDATTSGYDLQMIKTDSNGNMLWDKRIGGAGDQFGSSIQQTSDGGYITVGAKFPADYSTSYIYLVKTSSSGIMTWEKTFSGNSGQCVRVTSDGGYIIAAQDRNYYGCLIKTNSSGTLTWQKTICDGNLESVEQTSDGGYIAAGNIDRTFPDYDLYMIKTDSSGNKTWDRSVGGSLGDLAFSVTATNDGGYIAVGFTESFGAGQRDIYLVKIK